jgi:hypothetical protein
LHGRKFADANLFGEEKQCSKICKVNYFELSISDGCAPPPLATHKKLIEIFLGPLPGILTVIGT